MSEVINRRRIMGGAASSSQIPETPEFNTDRYLVFNNVDDKDVDINMYFDGNSYKTSNTITLYYYIGDKMLDPDPSLFTSKQLTFSDNSTQLFATIPLGKALYIYGNDNVNKWSCYDTYWGHYYTQFKILDKVNIGGKIEALGLPVKDTNIPYYPFLYFFKGCTGIISAKHLIMHSSSSIIQKYAYYYMFQNCTSLTEAPELPATYITTGSYQCMFIGCTSLRYVKAMFTNYDSYYTQNWLYNVAETGIFVKNPEATWTATGASGVPEGWEITTEDNINAISKKSLNPNEFGYTSAYVVLSTGDTNYSSKLPTLKNPYNLSVTYTSSDTSIATVDSSGLVTVQDLSTGINTYISAYTAADDQYNEKTSKYCIDIIDHAFVIKNTKSDNTIQIGMERNADNNSDYPYINVMAASAPIGTPYNERNYTNYTDSFTLDVPPGYAFYIYSDVMNTYNNNANTYNIRFIINNDVEWGGNIMSLLANKSFGSYLYQFAGLFQDCTGITTTPELPSTTTTKYCYSRMFKGCTSLTTAPKLPATTLSTGSYRAMFEGCTSLTVAPELPATKWDQSIYMLASDCYSRMFSGCTSLTVAPELPATSLGENCYEYMFNGCTSLTVAPKLPATSFASYCYMGMFNGCTGLTTAPELPATTLNAKCYKYMFKGCTGLTTLPELPATTLPEGCYDGMFQNCTGLTTIYVHALNLGYDSLDWMFGGCTGLTAAEISVNFPNASSRASYMFYNCSNLAYIKCLSIGGYEQYHWVEGVSSTGTFVKNANIVKEWPIGGAGIPTGWTVLSATE